MRKEPTDDELLDYGNQLLRVAAIRLDDLMDALEPRAAVFALRLCVQGKPEMADGVRRLIAILEETLEPFEEKKAAA